MQKFTLLALLALLVPGCSEPAPKVAGTWVLLPSTKEAMIQSKIPGKLRNNPVFQGKFAREMTATLVFQDNGKCRRENTPHGEETTTWTGSWTRAGEQVTARMQDKEGNAKAWIYTMEKDRLVQASTRQRIFKRQ